MKHLRTVAAAHLTSAGAFADHEDPADLPSVLPVAGLVIALAIVLSLMHAIRVSPVAIALASDDYRHHGVCQ